MYGFFFASRVRFKQFSLGGLDENIQCIEELPTFKKYVLALGPKLAKHDSMLETDPWNVAL